MKYDRIIRANIQLINAPDYTDYRGEIDIRDLRMSFSVFKTFSWSTNKADLRIYNLGRDKRNQLYNIGDLVSIYAGYKDNGGEQLIFRGNTTEVNHMFPQPEVISSLICADGDKTLNNKIIAVAFGSNVPVRDVIAQIASLMDIPLGSDLPPVTQVYALGFEGCDLAKNLLDKACKYANLWWGVQNGNLVFQPKNAPNAKPPSIINADTGMIGIPERFAPKRNSLYLNMVKPGWKIRTLLTPEILPGDRVIIKSERAGLNGQFYVDTIQHEGDNFSDNFSSVLEVIDL